MILVANRVKEKNKIKNNNIYIYKHTEPKGINMMKVEKSRQETEKKKKRTNETRLAGVFCKQNMLNYSRTRWGIF